MWLGRSGSATWTAVWDWAKLCQGGSATVVAPTKASADVEKVHGRLWRRLRKLVHSEAFKECGLSNGSPEISPSSVPCRWSGKDGPGLNRKAVDSQTRLDPSRATIHPAATQRDVFIPR